jgi:hypothetical protein
MRASGEDVSVEFASITPEAFISATSVHNVSGYYNQATHLILAAPVDDALKSDNALQSVGDGTIGLLDSLCYPKGRSTDLQDIAGRADAHPASFRRP